MTPLKKPLVFASTLIVVTLLLSWTIFDDYAVKSTTRSSLSLRNKMEDAAMNAFITDDGPSSPTDQPPAEDVLVQRIKKDNDHMLIMAYYSKENYSGPAFTIENGSTITLSDDGTGDDQVAGDGFYTAKITVDVEAFRDQASSLNKLMKDKNSKPVKYHARQKIADPNADASFDLKRFDKYQPASISGMTLVLPDLGIIKKPKKDKSLDLSANAAIAVSVAGSAQAAATAAPTTLDSIRQNSILITNLAVVEDPTRTWNSCAQRGNANGSWTFGTLMRQLASKSPTQIATDAQLSAYVKNWLNNWAATQVINGDAVAGRTLINSLVLDPWLAKSQNAGSPSGQLDMRFAPFKLTAIVNRFDLRNPSQLTGVFGSNYGEGRFVFCLIKSDCSGPSQMTVIFEYRIRKANPNGGDVCDIKHDWAQQWVDLKNLRLGSSQYNQALQDITDQFTLCGTNPSRPNQSSLQQIRTNEIALASATPLRWEFREFNLDNTTGNLNETTTAQSPADKFDAHVVNADVQSFVSFVNTNQAKIIAEKDTVPLTWQGVPFLAGASRINGNPTGNPTSAYHWNGTGSSNSSTFITDDVTRFIFSVQTCSGCHAGETQTAFTHINPVFFGTEAGLSGFLSGVKGSGGAIDFDFDNTNQLMQVKDAALRPSSNPTMRNFNDIDRRARGLLSYVSTPCGTVLAISSDLMFEPTDMVH